MKISKEEILKIVDRCFHMYASSYRNDAKKEASKMIEELERVENVDVSVSTIVEEILKPKYMNDVYTWKQVRDAILKATEC